MSESLAVRVGRQIASARYCAQESQRELAGRCGLSQSRLSRLEAGQGVTFDDVELLAEALGVPVSTLVRQAEGGPSRVALQRRPLIELDKAVDGLKRELARLNDEQRSAGSAFERMVALEASKAALLVGARQLLAVASAVAIDFTERSEVERGPRLSGRRRRVA